MGQVWECLGYPTRRQLRRSTVRGHEVTATREGTETDTKMATFA